MRNILRGVLALGLLGFIVFTTYLIKANSPQPQTPADVQILKRTLSLLSLEENWLPGDDRDCARQQKQRSVYCALVKASTEVSGEFRVRSASVRKLLWAIGQVKPDSGYRVPLRDFSNDPTVGLEQVHQALNTAIEALEKDWAEGAQ
ncbi:MAG: hypothetical protein QNJ40_13105 [Xanthomonadales bacterium]|nr:hypothetical protein [Xanthomonadales bacterium]